MDTNFENNKQLIINELNKKAKNLKCPVCNNENLIIGDGYIAHDLQRDLNVRSMGGQNIPTIPIICSNCGYIREFAAGALGLLPKKDENKSL